MRVIVHVDGGARGNPGPAAAAAVVSDADGQVLDEAAEVLGVVTNNVAEYRGLLLGLQRAQELGATEVDVVNDSELVAKQVNGEYKVKHADMKPLHRAATEVARGVRPLVGALRAAGAERPRGRARQPGAGRAHGLMRETLRSLSGYGGVLFDLDGTLYRGDTALPGAADFVRACRDAGLKVAFGTNNALLERDRIAARLQGMGIDADPDELVTAPDALAAVVQGAGHTHVVRLGNAGLRESLERVGIAAPDVMDAEPGDGTALALGLDPERSLAGVARAAAFVEAGVPVYATAAEPHYPTDRGIEAGTGTMHRGAQRDVTRRSGALREALPALRRARGEGGRHGPPGARRGGLARRRRGGRGGHGMAFPPAPDGVHARERSQTLRSSDVRPDRPCGGSARFAGLRCVQASSS